MRNQIVVALWGLLLFGCESKQSTGGSDRASTLTTLDKKPTAPLVDLTASSTLAPVRAAFNAKRGEARFLTLLSPT
jgi:hypothetical protein